MTPVLWGPYYTGTGAKTERFCNFVPRAAAQARASKLRRVETAEAIGISALAAYFIPNCTANA